MEKKKILITGKGSYVGTNLVTWLKQWPDQYDVDELSVRGDEWKKYNFRKYDSVLHVAGIAHVSRNPKMEEQYYKVNRDLTFEVANHVKNCGVKQFIFMSSIIVYGDSGVNRKVIDINTIPKPNDFYGDSKLQAENEIKEIETDKFKVVIVRPPMIYGKGSKGNFRKLVKVAKFLPVFPNVENQRSMLYIDNLSEFLKLIIKNEERGLFFPQNTEYINTSNLVKQITRFQNRKILLLKGFSIPISVFINRVPLLLKVFGDLVYEKELGVYRENYQVKTLDESIKKSI
ncbi:NAD-dependent epimerase/dehydratase family protein [Planococcus sp. SSTMD024]|uniref:NAD-dependent epimerase/dehydratase family protein n=1 Tax=Planococcus sp. SSTMD024 TaxID=3242163 RepID=UPI00351E788A